MDGIYPIGPALPHFSIEQWRSIWRKCRNVIAGEEAVKLAGEAYLPKMSRMSAHEYEAYKLRALFYGASNRTIQGLMGALLRKPPAIHASGDVLIKKLETLTENITQTGSSLQSFTRDIANEILSVGRVGVLVDAPPASNRVLAPKPYARFYCAEDILNWRMRFEDGVPVLVQVSIVEVIFTPGPGGFGVEEAIQYRELFLDDFGFYQQRVWVIDPPQNEDDTPKPRIIEEITPLYRGKPLKDIPFFFCSTTHNRPEIERPPLLDLINVNLSHYRSSADLEHGRHFTALPTPVVVGVDNDESGAPPSLEIGASTAWLLPMGASARMLEFNGQGLKHLENALDEKVTIMTHLGARMLETVTARGETAEALRLKQAGDFAAMNTMSDCISAMMSNVLRLMAWWGDVITDPDDKSIFIELNKDYFESQLTPAMLTALVSAWQAGALGFRDLYENMVRGEMIDPTREYADVMADVKQELDVRMKSLLLGGDGATPRVGQGGGTSPNGDSGSATKK